MRWSTDALAARFAALSGADLGPGVAPANLSIVVGDTQGPIRSKHELYVQGSLFATVADPGDLFRATIRAAATLVAERPPGALVLDARPVLAPDGRVVLVDRGLDAALRTAERRLGRAGYVVVNAAHVPVDVRAGRLRLGDAAAALRVDRSALDDAFPTTTPVDRLAGIDAEITRLVFGCRERPVSLGAAVASMTGLLGRREGHRLETSDVADLVTLAGAIEAVPFPFDDPPSLVDLVTGR